MLIGLKINPRFPFHLGLSEEGGLGFDSHHPLQAFAPVEVSPGAGAGNHPRVR